MNCETLIEFDPNLNGFVVIFGQTSSVGEYKILRREAEETKEKQDGDMQKDRSKA